MTPHGPRRGRLWCLPSDRRVLLIAVGLRTNLTMRQMAPLFGASIATARRIVQRLSLYLALEPAARPEAAAERLPSGEGQPARPIPVSP
ncbi:hypothetical protein GCM10023205_79510 [Yinghuangia aomiensis]|uniref:Transposase Helix-turn-helix domain-containing protein n=1 Tax=Yinghuangia aomiensis TaxID=676205 RepID=A0ABP9ICJ3_9ACTN